MHNPYISDKCTRSDLPPRHESLTIPTPITNTLYTVDPTELFCLSLYVGFDRFRGVFFEIEEEFVLYLGDGRLSSPCSLPLFPSFPPFFSHQKSFSFKNNVWVIGVPFCEWFWPWYWLLICLYRSVFRPDAFSSILTRRFWSSGGVFSLWGESVSLWARSRTIRAKYKPPGKISSSPFTFLLF